MDQGFESIDGIIRDECLAQDDLNLSNYLKYLSFAKEALRDWSLDKKNDIKVIVSTTSTIATLAFPDDYLQLSKIGTIEGDRIKTCIVNNKLVLYHATEDGAEVNNSPYQPNFGNSVSGILSGSYYAYNLNYDTTNAIYGYGNGGYLNDGEFRVDAANRRFQFSSDWASKEVYLEYVGTGLNPTGQTVVDGNTSKSIKLYIRWQALEVSRTASLGEKQRAEQQYWNENLTATKRSVVSLDKIFGIAKEAYKTTPKM